MMRRLTAVWANPWVRRPALLVLGIGGVLAACWVTIDRWGRNAWREVQKELAAEGETLEFRRLLPLEVPDAENFCAVGPLRNVAAAESDHSPVGDEGRRNRQRIWKMREDAGFARAMPSNAGLSDGKAFDLRKLAEVMRRDGSSPIPKIEGDLAADVTAGFANWDAYFDELTPALARSAAEWTPALKNCLRKPPLIVGGLPYIEPSRQLARLLSLRAIAAAAAGDVQRAITCVHCLERVAEACTDEPLLIGALVAEDDWRLMAKVLWELCHAQRGTPADWEQLERLFAGFDARTPALQGLRGEMALGVDLVLFARDHSLSEMDESFRASGWYPSKYDPPVPETVRWLMYVAPPGLYESCAAETVHRRLKFQIRPLRDGDLASLLGSDQAMERDQQTRLWWNIPAIYARVMGSSPVLFRLVYWKTLMNQATIACALERFRLAQGSYPPVLDNLTLADGRPLPLDAASGQPMHYRPTDDGRYVLWALGPDGKDDGGRRASVYGIGVQHTEYSADYEGDWVWGFAPER
jgi:hypothetical protein